MESSFLLSFSLTYDNNLNKCLIIMRGLLILHAILYPIAMPNLNQVTPDHQQSALSPSPHRRKNHLSLTASIQDVFLLADFPNRFHALESILATVSLRHYGTSP